MTRWVAFAGVAVLVLAVLLVLARASQSVVSDISTAPDRWLDRLPDGADHLDATATPRPLQSSRDPSSVALLLNVAVSQGIFATVLLAAVWWAQVPMSTLGVSGDPWSTGWPALVVGVGAGIALVFANTLAGGLARAVERDPSERLRELLAPDSAAGWLLLFFAVLPTIAVFEELLFRAVLIGAFSAGFDLSPWLLAVVSSVAFAVGHGAQGGLGVVVTGLLGFALAVVFVVTNSLLAVVVAHYLVNAAEFVVAEGLGWEPFG